MHVEPAMIIISYHCHVSCDTPQSSIESAVRGIGCMCSKRSSAVSVSISVSSIAVASSNNDEQLCAVIAVLSEVSVDDKCHVIYIDV